MPPPLKVRNRKAIRLTTTPAVSGITESAAVASWSTSVPGTTVLEYGPTTAYGAVVTDSALVTAHSVTLSGLAEDTTYYYRATSVDQFGSSVRASGSFATLAAPPDPAPDPIAVSAGPSVSGITQTTAVVAWTTNVAGTSEVDFGIFDTYGLTRDIQESVTSHSVGLTNLTPGKTYHYRVRSDGASSTVQSTDHTFATLADTTPTPPSPGPGGGTPNVAGGLTSAQLQSAIQALVNAHTPVVLTNTTYNLSGTVTLTGTPVIDLNGAILQWSNYCVGLKLANTTDAVVYGSGGKLRGFDTSGRFVINADGSDGPNDGHGIAVEGGTNVTIGRDTTGDLTIENFRGDGIYAVASFATGVGVSGSGLTIGDGVIFGNLTRMGLGIVGFNDGVMGAARFTGTMYRPIDFEPDWASGYQAQCRRWTIDGAILNGNFRGRDGSGANWFYIGTPYTNPGGGRTVPSIEDITIKNCTITSTGITAPHNAMFIDVRDYTAHRITVTDNIATNAYNTGMTASHVETLVVTGNDMNTTVPYPVTASCTSVTQSGNT